MSVPSATRGLFVLGMHRSGTSMTTRLVNLLGVPLVGADDLLEPNDANPTGYWESVSLTAINDRVLDLFDGAWYAPPEVGAEWHLRPELEALAREARETVRTLAPGPVWAWKDPRTCLTLPFWLHALAPIDPVVVICHRHPLELADSLRRRDDLPVALSLALWERYVRAALAASAGLPAFVVRYERAVDEPVAVADELRGFLRSHGYRVGADGASVIARFVEPSLRRSRPSVGEDGALEPRQLTLLSRLEELEGAHERLALPPLEPEPPVSQALFDAQRRIVHLEATVAVASEEEAVRRAEVARVDHERAKLELEVAQLRHELEAARAHGTAVQAELAAIKGTRAWRALDAAHRLRRLAASPARAS